MPKSNGLYFSTDREIQSLKPQEKRYSAKDKLCRGLFIEVRESGVKSWHYRYSLNGKQDRIVIGRYPDLKLKDVREIHSEYALLVAKGISPKKQSKPTNSITVNAYAERYYNEVIIKDRKNPYNMRLCLDNDILPMIGDMQLNQVTTEDIRKVIWRKKDQGYDSSANQVRGLLKRMFDYAMTLGLVPFNPVLAIPSRHVYKSIPRDRYLSTAEIRTYYTTLLNSRIYRPRKLALLLSLLTLVRKGDLNTAQWSHIDFDAREWHFPKPKADSQTGQSRPLVVYMSDQIIEILKELKVIAVGSPYVFAGRKNGTHISHNVLNTAQKTALALTNVPHFTIHDLRRTASTHLNEQGFNGDAIEACLNHTIKSTRGVYNKATYKANRIEMMQKWSDYIFSVIYEPNLIFFNESKGNKVV